MMTSQQSFRLFVYADWAMLTVGFAAISVSIGWVINAIFRTDKGRRRQTLRKALICILVFAMFWATQLSVTILFVNDHWTPLLMVLFALPIVVMLAGLIASIVYGTLPLFCG